MVNMPAAIRGTSSGSLRSGGSASIRMRTAEAANPTSAAAATIARPLPKMIPSAAASVSDAEDEIRGGALLHPPDQREEQERGRQLPDIERRESPVRSGRARPSWLR